MRSYLRFVLSISCLVLLCALTLTACFQRDDDGLAAQEEQMLDRRMAQSYILGSYAQWNPSLVHDGLGMLVSLDSILGEYRWEGKEEGDVQFDQYALSLATGDLTYLRRALAYCDEHAGAYEADANKVLHKTQDADHQLSIALSDSTTLSLAWNVDDATEGEAKVQLFLRLNDYLLSGTTTIRDDSVNSSYQLAKGVGGEPLATLRRKMKGTDFLEAFLADSTATVVPTSSDLKLELRGGLCLHKTMGDWNVLLKFLTDHRGIAVTDPKRYQQEWAKVRNELGRTVLTRTDGVVLCEVIDGMETSGDDTLPLLLLCWNDGTMQSLTSFASSIANEDFAKDAALLTKLWEKYYNLSVWNSWVDTE